MLPLARSYGSLTTSPTGPISEKTIINVGNFSFDFFLLHSFQVSLTTRRPLWISLQENTLAYLQATPEETSSDSGETSNTGLDIPNDTIPTKELDLRSFDAFLDSQLVKDVRLLRIALLWPSGCRSLISSGCMRRISRCDTDLSSLTLRCDSQKTKNDNGLNRGIKN